MSDYLEPYREVIAGVGDDYIERQVLIWSILNYVPLRQFSQKQIYVLFYEKLFENPQDEIGNLFEFLYGSEGKRHVSSAMTEIKRLSFVAGAESMIAQGKSPVSGWLSEVTTQQKEAGYRILSHFGLDELYRQDGHANRNGIEGIFLI